LTKADLSISILRLLFTENREMRASEIEKQLLVGPHDEDEENRFHVKLFRYLNELHEDELIEYRKVSRKDARYSIRDKEHVRWILDLDAAGWNASAAKALEMPSTVLRGLSYESAIQSISKYLFNVIIQRRNLEQETRIRCPAPLIIPVSISISAPQYYSSLPMPQQNGSMANEKFLVMIPNEISTSLMNSFSEEQYHAFINYLTAAWSLYFEQQNAALGNIVIIHFPDHTTERLQKIVDLGEYKNISEVVWQATLNYLDDPNKKNFLVTVDGPATKKAIERGKFKDKKAAVEAGLQMLEKKLKKQFDDQM